ncbi:hypothetical protein OPKNFCMD_4951 [Methylobacterium crusticola]|uniref:Uncharacterized protein n=2 Tax=Methylobacterium crusticola TaxID=1697972 RepID=A0ABQ4R5X2_9HYPH|nr:hypothetical protein OPKNFCMD_4951 [Methylobacterium crusticola]
MLILLSSVCGAGFALVSPWLPMFLASIALFLGLLVYHLAAHEGVLHAVGLAGLALAVFQAGYVAAGRVRESRIRRLAPMKDAPSKK